jgi:hypothetical protein
MGKKIFQEKQFLREVTLLWWMVVPVALAIILSLLYGVYWQLIMGVPWGTKPMSDGGLILLSLTSLAILMMVVWVLFSVRLETTVSEEGIAFQYYPHMRKFRQIPKVEIQAYTVKKLSFFEARRRGYRRSLTGRQQRLTISGRDALIITLISGKKIIIGTQKPSQLDKAMRQLMSANEFD